MGLLHNTLNAQGGAEHFTLTLMRILRQQGHRVVLATFDKPDWRRIKSRGYLPSCDDTIFLFPKRLPIFGIYQRTLMALLNERLASRCDLTINTHSDHLFCRTDLTYLHGIPYDNFLLRNIRSWPKKLYYFPHIALSRWFRSKGMFGTANPNGAFVANSSFTAEGAKKRLAVNADVIYPPVEVERYRALQEDSKEDLVLSVGRASWEKNLEVIPEIVEKTSDSVRFALVTTVNTNAGNRILQELYRAERRLGGRFKIYYNISQQEKFDLIRRAKVYLHTSPFETFGLSLAECVAAGLHPIAVNYGGHVEVLQGIENSLYSSAEEAAALIEDMMAFWTQAHGYILSSLMSRFNETNFSKQMIGKIKEVYEEKCRN